MSEEDWEDYKKGDRLKDKDGKTFTIKKVNFEDEWIELHNGVTLTLMQADDEFEKLPPLKKVPTIKRRKKS